MKPKDLNYIHRLQKPASAVDVVIDTDAYNQVDDLYALAYLLLSDEKLKLKGIFAAPAKYGEDTPEQQSGRGHASKL